VYLLSQLHEKQNRSPGQQGINSRFYFKNNQIKKGTYLASKAQFFKKKKERNIEVSVQLLG
jgi:hypothetical protein